jgi:uncharacterized delta-60 repeat protein
MLSTGVAFGAAGKLDPGFGTRGIVVTATAPGSGADFQNGLVIQPDGRILVGGESDMGPPDGFQIRLSRYTKKGALDATFGTGGTSLTSLGNTAGEDEHIWALALQTDGKIVASGDVIAASGSRDWAIVRYNADGTLDGSFGTGGVVTTEVGSLADRAFDVIIAGDGKILAAGFTTRSPADGGRSFALARYNSNGALDTSFGTNGIVVTRVAPGSSPDAINQVKFDSQGRIVVGGHADMGAGNGGFNLAAARYNPNGTLDTSFDTDGIVTTATAPGDGAEFGLAIAIDSTGRILLGGDAEMPPGSFRFDLAVVRFNSDGSLDMSFDGDGKVVADPGPGDTDNDLEGLLIQRTGKILIGGSSAPTSFGVDTDFLVARYLPDGSLDSSFGIGGIAQQRPERTALPTRSTTSRFGATPSSWQAGNATSPRPVVTSVWLSTRSARTTDRTGIVMRAGPLSPALRVPPPGFGSLDPLSLDSAVPHFRSGGGLIRLRGRAGGRQI